MANAGIDQNSRATLTALSSAGDHSAIVVLWADPTTHRLLIDSSGGSGITSINGDATTAQLITGANGIGVSNSTSGTTALSLGTITPTSVNGLTLASQAIGFTIAGGTTSKTLTVPLDASVSGTNTGDNAANSTYTIGSQTQAYNSNLTAINQALTTTSSPSFTTVTANLTGNASGTSANVTGIVLPINGGTGIANNNAQTVTGSGNFAFTRTLTNTTNVTFPTTGTLATLAGSEALTNKSLNGMTVTASTGTFTLTNAKTLSVSDTTTLATNAITLGGGEVITFSASNALSLLTTGTSVMTFPTATDTVVTLAATQTLTNKRITPRVLSAASYTTNTGTSIAGDTQDMFIVTAQAGDLLFNNPSGTPTDGQKLIITVASSTTAARALTWGNAYGATTVALPTTTTATTVTLSMGFIWSTSKSLWQIVAVA